MCMFVGLTKLERKHRFRFPGALIGLEPIHHEEFFKLTSRLQRWFFKDPFTEMFFSEPKVSGSFVAPLFLYVLLIRIKNQRHSVPSCVMCKAKFTE